MRSGKTINEGSTTVGVGERAQAKLWGESGVNGDGVGELLCEGMLQGMLASAGNGIETGRRVEMSNGL